MLYFLLFGFGFLFTTTVEASVDQIPVSSYELLKQKIGAKNQSRAIKVLDSERDQNNVNDSFIKKSVTMIIAPHPDDEVLCCSLKIKQKLEQGERVVVVYITDGDAKEKGNERASILYGQQRRGESIEAAEALGLKSNDLIFLNFPDGILDKLPVTGSMISPYTGQSQTSYLSYFPRVSYNLVNLEAKLTHLIEEFNPSELYVSNDTHHDHKFMGDFIKELVHSLVGVLPTVYEYSVHGRKINLESDVFSADKWKAIQIFKTQMHDAYHEKFMKRYAYGLEKFKKWIPTGMMVRE